jgi:hypothetical protein
MKNTVSKAFNPELVSRVRKYISVRTPMELEAATRILYAYKIEYRLEPYGENLNYTFDSMDRIDIVMNYHEYEEPEVIKALGIKQTDLNLYFDHS